MKKFKFVIVGDSNGIKGTPCKESFNSHQKAYDAGREHLKELNEDADYYSQGGIVNVIEVDEPEPKESNGQER